MGGHHGERAVRKWARMPGETYRLPRRARSKSSARRTSSLSALTPCQLCRSHQPRQAPDPCALPGAQTPLTPIPDLRWEAQELETYGANDIAALARHQPGRAAARKLAGGGSRELTNVAQTLAVVWAVVMAGPAFCEAQWAPTIPVPWGGGPLAMSFASLHHSPASRLSWRN